MIPSLSEPTPYPTRRPPERPALAAEDSALLARAIRRRLDDAARAGLAVAADEQASQATQAA